MCHSTTPLGLSLTRCLLEWEPAASGTFSVGFLKLLLKYKCQNSPLLFPFPTLQVKFTCLPQYMYLFSFLCFLFLFFPPRGG